LKLHKIFVKPAAKYDSESGVTEIKEQKLKNCKIPCWTYSVR